MEKTWNIQWVGSRRVGVPIFGWTEIDVCGIREDNAESRGFCVAGNMFPVTISKEESGKIGLVEEGDILISVNGIGCGSPEEASRLLDTCLNPLALRIFRRMRGEGDTDKNSNSTKGSPDSHKSRESSSSANIADTSPTSSSSTPDLTSKSVLHSSSHKVERRESARLASGASKFLRSLRSGGKESKDQVNVIALKELDSDHCLSPEGHGRPVANGRLPERSQSFQEKRLLIPLPSSKVTSSGGGGKGRHGRAQSFVCAQQPPQQLLLLKHHRHQQQQLHSNYLARRGGGGGLSPPQGINGLPPAPPRPLSNTGGTAKGCDTIYENLEVILEQNNLNKESVKRRRGDEGNQQRTYVNVDHLLQIRKDQQQQQAQDGSNNRKLRRSISEVPSDRMVAFPKKTPTTPTHNSNTGNLASPSKSQINPIYSNGLSIWKLETKESSEEVKKEENKSPTSSSGSSSNLSTYKPLVVALPGVGGPYSKPTSASVYSTLPRNSSSSHVGSTPSLSTTPTSSSAKSSAASGTNLIQSTGSSGSASSAPVGVPLLSPARSTPNLVSSKLSTLSSSSNSHPPQPIYREPPVYQPLANSTHSLGRIYRPSSLLSKSVTSVRPNPPQLSSSKSVENVVGTVSVKKSGEDSTGTGEVLSKSSKEINTKAHEGDQLEGGGDQKTVSMSSWDTSPTPVRDTSSLKAIRYGPGHEKYPSWPIPVGAAGDVDPAGTSNHSSSSNGGIGVTSGSGCGGAGSARSKSWTDTTDYPKEKGVSYARPYMKRLSHPAQQYTQQLKTVMEEKKGGVVPPPLGYRDGGNKDGQYAIPERDVTPSAVVTKPLTQEDVEAYGKKYEEMMSQYAGSEGYHSYISSECSSYVSSSGTPFLDLLRRESGGDLFWPDNLESNHHPHNNHLHHLLQDFSVSGRESVTTVVTNSSSSNSSSGTETLKWGGSEVSLASSGGSRWSDNNKRNANKNSLGGWNERELNLKKFPLNTYTRPTPAPNSHPPSHITTAQGKVSPPSKESPPLPEPPSPIVDTSKPPSVAERIWELEKKQSGGGTTTSSSNSSVSSSPLKTTSVAPSATTTSNLVHSKEFVKSSSLNNLREKAPLPLSTTPNVGGGLSQTLSTHEINESHHPVHYSYLDPEKKHKVADMTLKAIQKKALLSYYERHTGKTSSSSSSSSSSSDSVCLPPPPPPSTSSTSPTKEGSLLDSPFKSRLTLSLPRDVAPPSSLSSPSSSSPTSSTSSSSQAKHNKLLPPLPAKAHLHDNHQVEKDDVESVNSESKLDHSANGEQSARMARLGKYMPHLTKREAGSGAKSSCGGGAAFNPTSPLSSSAAAATSLHESSQSSPTPPERPPKKPHLRSYSHQIGAEDGENKPPPTLPRAPVRPPQPNNTPSPISHENGMGLSCHLVSAPPPVPSKPVVGVPVKAGIAVARCTSPDLPPPPPPIIPEEEVEVLNSELPLPPPPTMNEVTDASSHILGPRSRSVSGLSSYLHKDSYMAARKEKTLGYEGRYRRTLSPSGLGSKSGDDVTTASTTSISNATSTGKLDTSLSPSAWEKYHNIRPPSTTVIFSSQEIAKGASPFTRSISCDSNLFNNKTGFTQSSIPPPVAQVAPLRDSYASPPSPPTSLKEERPSLMVAPLHFEHNKENIPERREEEEEVEKDDNKETVKKSELCLRVNCTSDVASQTDTATASAADANKRSCSSTSSSSSSSSSSSLNADTPTLLETPSRSSSSSSRTPSSSSSFDDSVSTKGTMTVVSASYTGRQKRQEELECEELSRRLVQHLPNGDKLQKILVPLPEHKTTADYMGGLFQLEVELKVEKETNTSARSSPDLLQSLPKKGATPPASPTPTEVKRVNGHAPLPADSAYFTTSEVKAKFLTQYVNDMNKNDSLIGRSQDSQELNKQKEMLVSRISRKLDILKEEQLEIRKEIESNEQLGEEVIERVRGAATPSEFDKFKGHVAKIEKVTSLLLGLSGRLARAENALMSLAENSNPQERKILESKRDKLKEQLEEAKVLKEYTDGTSAAVSAILRKYLSPEAYADYTHFVKMKAKLIIDAREIDDKIKLGEEQMVALRDTLNYSTS